MVLTEPSNETHTIIYNVHVHTRWFHIFCPGPMKGTVVDFWRLVWQERVPTIAMVTKLKESSVSKCQRYWPETGTEKYGPFQVTLTKQELLADYVFCTLDLQYTAVRPLHPTVLYILNMFSYTYIHVHVNKRKKF